MNPIPLIVAALLLAFVAGWKLGHACGLNEGWLAKYFEEVRRDRERRDAQGKFKARTNL